MNILSKLPSLLKRKIRISIVLPVYNAEKHLCKCIDSILDQDFNRIEIIIVNDCSTDSSLDIIRKYNEKSPLLKVINQKNNKGAGASRNDAIKVARGKYLTFIDSDDWFGDGFLEALYEEAESSNADIVFSNMIMVQNKIEQKYGRFNDTFIKYNKNNTLISRLPCDWRSTAPWMKLFRKDFVLNNDLKFVEGIRLGAEDIPFSWIAYFISKKISFCENTYYYYNYIPESLDRCVNENILEIFDVLNFTKSEYHRFDPHNKRKALLYALYVSHISYQFSKITSQDTPENIILASRYWSLAHNYLSSIPKVDIKNNNCLQDNEKELFYDIGLHPFFDRKLQDKYFTDTAHE